MKTLHHYINGRRVEGLSGHFGDVHNPATGAVAARAPFASRGEVEAAIGVADAAFPAWAATPPAKRAQVLFRFRDLILRHMDELAELVSCEHGKTIADAKGSITRGLEVVEFACGIPHLLKGEYSEAVASGVDAFSFRQPLGVCAGITPFNFPAMVPLWMFPMAIACGNTFILKPSEKDPSTALRLAELMTEAGLPDGVLNVVIGDKGTVDTLLADRRVPAISFVGSTAVGRYIYATGCANGKRVQALCGAKNHMIVMPDADLEQATDALVGAAYGSAGERCMAISVAVAVGDAVGDELIGRLAPRVRSLKVGPYTDAEAEMGPIITRDSLDRIRAYVDSGVREGAELVVDGRHIAMQGHEKGFFMGGCLFDRVTPDMAIYREEIFGPVLSVVRTPDYETALGLVNDHVYGNGTAIFTRDGDAARDFVTRAQAGMIGVNVPIPVPVAYHSFGGWKQSLFGDIHIHGPEGVRFYTKLKAVTTRWPSGIRTGAQFHFRSGAEH
ncbi:MAG TPA: CoA-acylating methylmalonate-semialdehyde dehydrogenase [Azospirillaceae bacterium]|nr:CoA-acylating methylmalonate-semialdehyde dehydrogenase [Azospirillaceae bacterium]